MTRYGDYAQLLKALCITDYRLGIPGKLAHSPYLAMGSPMSSVKDLRFLLLPFVRGVGASLLSDSGAVSAERSAGVSIFSSVASGTWFYSNKGT